MKRLISFFLCISMCISLMPAVSAVDSVRNVEFEEELAQDLKDLGLFKGVSDTEFDLSRAPSRTEALVMLIRVLGKEQDALDGNWTHPFTDVVKWADKYVGYAYENGLTNGISPTKFGSDQTANAAMYTTFVLRALGYSDKGGEDFTWNDPFTLADDIGILHESADLENFLRADVVILSYRSLDKELKDSKKILAEKLIDAGVFTEEEYKKYYRENAFVFYKAPKKEVTLQQVYKDYAPSVFYIETYDIDGEPNARGSGFFLHSSGLAVTNYHIFDNAVSAKAYMNDGSECDIIGVYESDEMLDFAVIKVDGKGFDALEIGRAGMIEDDDKIYALSGYRMAYISHNEGKIIKAERKDHNDMIQISVPISDDMSGGPLIDEDGEVIGVLTDRYADLGLNLALPISSIMKESYLQRYVDSREYLSVQEYAVSESYRKKAECPDPNEIVIYDRETDGGVPVKIDCGITVSGNIKGSDIDSYIVNCNTGGFIFVNAVGGATEDAAKDLKVECVPYTGGEAVYSTYTKVSDGVYSNNLTYTIPKTGKYIIRIYGTKKHPEENLSSNYTLYYTFTPTAGKTPGDDKPTGDVTKVNRSVNSRKTAYDAILKTVKEDGRYYKKYKSYSLPVLEDEEGAVYVFVYYEKDDMLCIGIEHEFKLSDGTTSSPAAVILELKYGNSYTCECNSFMEDGEPYLIADINAVKYEKGDTAVIREYSKDATEAQKRELSETLNIALPMILSRADEMFDEISLDSLTISDFGFNNKYK